MKQVLDFGCKKNQDKVPLSRTICRELFYGNRFQKWHNFVEWEKFFLAEAAPEVELRHERLKG